MYKGTLIAVKDMEESKKFYHDIMKMNVVGDFGANVQLEGGLFLQTLDTWSHFIDNKRVYLENNAVELYFEVSDIDEFYEKLQIANIELVHELLEQNWGQRVVRFYDPNHHIIEVGEEMPMVVKRFLHDGMTMEQVAKRMDVSMDYIKECLGR
ncbi:MAG: glyoxalase [Clostridiales bacterium]|jgi:catechol 2,3-dioxygenase-like lactoylglutathione lyase family enzyme|nr:glyoxalase [Clostridiales bacterium]